MKETKGWICLHRTIWDSDLWKKKPFADGQAWIDLLLMANHEPITIKIGNEHTALDRGMFHTSELKLMSRWGWSKKKVRGFLQKLEQEEMIQREPGRQGTSIKIINYDKYQQKRETAKGTAGETATETATTSVNKGITRKSGTAEVTAAGTTKGTQTTNINKYKQDKEKVYKEKEPRHKYGEYKNVLLSDKELAKLKELYPDTWEERIENISYYCESKGKTYSNYLAAIRSWDRKDKKQKGGVDNEQRSKQRELYDTNNIFG